MSSKIGVVNINDSAAMDLFELPIESEDIQMRPFYFAEDKVLTIKKAMPWLITFSLSFVFVSAVILACVYGMSLDQPVYATKYMVTTASSATSTLLGVGQSCTASSQCIQTAFCSTTTNRCACSPQLYLDSTTGTCLTRKTFGQSCKGATECEYFINLSCISNVCDCVTTEFFWNNFTNKCEDKRGLAQTCNYNTDCLSSTMTCDYYNGGQTKRCVCASGQYYSFKTGSCQSSKIHGDQCSDEYSHFECVDNAWCTPFPNDMPYRCSCHPDYYNNGAACLKKKAYGNSCTYSYECLDYQGQTCISSVCGCPTNTFWNKTNCDPKKPYGGVCNKTSDCLYTGLICTFRPEQQDYGCMCPNGTYYSLSTSSCTNYVSIGSTCVDNYECNVNQTCSLVTSSNKQCQCSSPYFYQVGTTNQCLLVKNYTTACSSATECNSLLGLTVCNTGGCDCATGYFWNGVECEIKKGYEAATGHSQYCTNAYECNNAKYLTVCSKGSCLCTPGKTYSVATLTCT